jgi:hypothetical protein
LGFFPEIKFQNFIKESVVVDAYKRPEKNPKTIRAKYGSKKEGRDIVGKCPVGSLYLSGLLST